MDLNGDTLNYPDDKEKLPETIGIDSLRFQIASFSMSGLTCII